MGRERLRETGDWRLSFCTHKARGKTKQKGDWSETLAAPCYIFRPVKTVTRYLAPSAISTAAHNGVVE